MTATEYIRLFKEPLDFDWQENGDEFLHHLHIALCERVDVQGFSSQQHQPTESAPYYGFGFKPTSESFTTEIAFFPAKSGGFLALVGITDRSQVPEQVDPWAEAIQDAIDRLDAEKPTFDWWGAIGPVGLSTNGPPMVANSVRIGGMIVHKSTSLYLDAVEGEIPSIGGFSIEASYPVVVEGTAAGYEWSVAVEPCSEQLNIVCALLSVALDVNWRIRQGPSPGPFGDSQLPRARMGVEGHGVRGWGGGHEVSIPGWCTDAWEKVAVDETLATALHAHHTALALEEITPSYALVAYIGVLEGLGAKLEPLQRCETCKTKLGAMRRFREALRLVVPEEEVKQLFKLYSNRSSVVHEGRLLGNEATRATIPLPRRFSPPSGNLYFRFQSVARMRNASRLLLLHYLR